MRPIGVVLFEQNDKWQTSGRQMMVEAFADRHGGDRPHPEHNHESRLIMTSGHPGNYTTLTDATRLAASRSTALSMLGSQ